jgi:antitoxin MazE
VEATIRKWGNSPAVRINAAAMKLASFEIAQRVRIKASKGRIVIEPADHVEYRIEDLVRGINRRNVHGEVDAGAPVGREAL